MSTRKSVTLTDPAADFRALTMIFVVLRLSDLGPIGHWPWWLVLSPMAAYLVLKLGITWLIDRWLDRKYGRRKAA